MSSFEPFVGSDPFTMDTFNTKLGNSFDKVDASVKDVADAQSTLGTTLGKAIVMDELYSPFPLTTQVFKFVYGNGYFVAVSPGHAIYSTDGLTWFNANNADLAEREYSGTVCFSNGKFFTTDTLGRLYRSETGENWELFEESTPIMRLLEVNSPILFGMENTSINPKVLWSEDGKTWIASVIDFSSKIAYGNGKYIALKNVRGNTVQGWRSSDGKSWTSFTLFPPGYTNFSYYGICFGDGKFVAVGDQVPAAVTTDGSSWEFGSTTLSNYDMPIFWKGRFYSFSSSSSIFSSENGLDWTKYSNNITSMIYQAVTSDSLALLYNNNQPIFYNNNKLINLPIITQDMKNFTVSKDPPPLTYPNGKDITDYFRNMGLARVVLGRSATNATNYQVSVPFMPSIIFGIDSGNNIFCLVQYYDNNYRGWSFNKNIGVTGNYYPNIGSITINSSTAAGCANQAPGQCKLFVFA